MNKLVLLSFISCLFMLHTSVCAQREGHVWVFGNKAGLDFNSGPPVPVSTGIDSWEGCASQCDASGQLLFYTEGRSIWNRNHVRMPNAQDLLPLNPSNSTASSYGTTSQQAVIVPMPGYPEKYYVFSLQPNNHPGSLCYSLVDMNLDNGLGDVLQGQRSVHLDSNLTERMTVVAGMDCNAWVLVRSRSANEYRAYQVTAAGLDTTPVVSVCGNLNPGAYRVGTMKFSHDGRKLASACGRQGSPKGIELYDFDPATGIVSNPVGIDVGGSDPVFYYGLAFSPDDSKLYASGNVLTTQYAYIYQFDLAQPSAAAITASRVVVTYASQRQAYDIKTAPDGKIYFMWDQDHNSLHVINFPNLPGAACQPVLNAVPLLPGTQVTLGLPNAVVAIRPPDTAYLPGRTVVVCIRDSVVLEADTLANGHVWDDGTTGPVRTVYAAGTYVAGYQHLCTWYIDSITVVFPSPFPVPGPDGYSCKEEKTTIWCIPRDTAVFTYTWTDAGGALLHSHQGSQGDSLKAVGPGIYTVHIRSPLGCDTIVRITVHEHPKPQASFTADSDICAGEPLPFFDRSGEPELRWDFGDQAGSALPDPVHTYRHTGVYQVVLAVKNTTGCSDTATGVVQVRALDLQLNASSRAVPWRGAVTLTTDAAEPYAVTSWEPAWLFPDQAAYSQHFTTDTARRYIVTGISAYGCRDTADVFVDIVLPDLDASVWMPTAFSPDGDGMNDRFRPVIGVWASLRFRYFHVYDRWGKIVWGTQSHTQALAGWDGTYGGTPATLGVYFYSVEIETTSGRKQIITKKGDFTLIR